MSADQLSTISGAMLCSTKHQVQCAPGWRSSALIQQARRQAGRAHFFILGLKLFFCDVQLHVELLVIVKLAQYVRVVGLALSDGGVKGDHDKGLGDVGLGQNKQTNNGVVLYSVVLSLHRHNTRSDT